VNHTLQTRLHTYISLLKTTTERNCCLHQFSDGLGYVFLNAEGQRSTPQFLCCSE